MEKKDMSYLKEQAEWADGIYQIETSDPVLGGPDGITNRPALELANRTAWLKQQLKDAEAALTAHTRSRNHPDASLNEKGFVKLSNANQSNSETEAATPKAVKIVNDRINAVVDHAPSDLDTLNKLAKAISNNPKFAESVTQLLSQKLAKNENGADIPDKNQFVKNLGLTETVDCAKNALDKRTGGTVKGDIISQGTQISLKGDGRKHLGFHNQDGSVRMWLYKDKGGDGVRLNNGNDGGGEYVFHKDGGFRAPSSVYAGAARMAADGNIYGSKWGNQWLDAYLRKTFQPKGAYGQSNTAKREVNGWWKCGDTGLIIQWGKTDNEGFDRKILPLPLPFPNEGLWALGWVAEAIWIGADQYSHSAGLVDKAHIKVTTDYNLATAWIAIGY
ncbi:tail fiber protein [Arsenophonus sp. ENCA]|uniref:tail fiber protein n=1 Tax=Arsenophonus sp. ENCA TaxID=1987579 RepID=UPI0025B8AB0C|nr:tail fiber protein [Arsenophonus sp. ENCA]